MSGPPGRMTLREYEERYREALDVIRRKFRVIRVGDPETTPVKARLVSIDGKGYNDEMVFTLAWGRETAKDIVAQRKASGR